MDIREYNKTIQSLHNRLGNNTGLNESKNEKFILMNFDKNDLLNKLRPYSTQISSFVIVLILLFVFRPEFVLKKVIVNDMIEQRVCVIKILVWSAIIVIGVNLLVQLYKFKMVKTTNMFYG
jgi:hypothetical protein